MRCLDHARDRSYRKLGLARSVQTLRSTTWCDSAQSGEKAPEYSDATSLSRKPSGTPEKPQNFSAQVNLWAQSYNPLKSPGKLKEGNFPSPALPGAGSTGLPRTTAELSAILFTLGESVGSPAKNKNAAI
jgi:hypothetical protein